MLQGQGREALGSSRLHPHRRHQAPWIDEANRQPPRRGLLQLQLHVVVPVQRLLGLREGIPDLRRRVARSGRLGIQPQQLAVGRLRLFHASQCGQRARQQVVDREALLGGQPRRLGGQLELLGGALVAQGLVEGTTLVELRVGGDEPRGD
jgi:hypothetical protein